MNFRVVIPARYQSSRFPGKLLQQLAGKPLIQHTYERACESEVASCVIATDDERIAHAARQFGAPVIMTSPSHPTGTDRLAEAVVKAGYADDDIIINVQGDEPLIPPQLIMQVAHNLKAHASAMIATLCWPITHKQELFNPHVVKVVYDQHGFALYFSRASIPWEREAFAQENFQLKHCFRHVGIYAYRAGFLQQYVTLKPTPLDELEQLEQLRAMAYGYKIHVAQAEVLPLPDVNTQEDLAKLAEML